MMNRYSGTCVLSPPPRGRCFSLAEKRKNASGCGGSVPGCASAVNAVTPPSADPCPVSTHPPVCGSSSPCVQPSQTKGGAAAAAEESSFSCSCSCSSPSCCHHHHHQHQHQHQHHQHHHDQHHRSLAARNPPPPPPPLSTSPLPHSPPSSSSSSSSRTILQHSPPPLSTSVSSHKRSASSTHLRYTACHSHSQSLPAQISSFASSPSRSTASHPRPPPLRHTCSSTSRTRSSTSNINTTFTTASNTTSSSFLSSTVSSPTSSTSPSSLASSPSSADQDGFQASPSTPSSPSNVSYYSALALHQIRQLSNPNFTSYTSVTRDDSALTPLLLSSKNTTSTQQPSSNLISSFTTLRRAKTVLIGKHSTPSSPPPNNTFQSNKYAAQEHPFNRYSQPEHKSTSPSISNSAPPINLKLGNYRFEREDYFNNCPTSPKFSQRPPSYDTLEAGNQVSITAIDNQHLKMHQSSSRLLRMTQDDRPFTKDFKDLFSTLIVSLPLTSHRLRFKTYNFSFTSDEAVNNLGSLKFSQSNRMPDPKDPSRIVTTTTTTTFSMAKEMARTVCQKFVAARFMEAVAEKTGTPFTAKNILWQLTPKGIHVLEQFCQRNGINSPHILNLLASPSNTMKLVILERDVVTDKLSHDKTTVEIIFRRFAGATPNVKSSTSLSDSDSISEYSDGNTGIRIAESRKVFDKIAKYSFTGKSAVDWLLDCCTTIEPLETVEIAELFLKYGLIQAIVEDKMYIQQNPAARLFQPTKTSIYIFTEKGKRVAGWIENERGSMNLENRPRMFENGYNSTTAIASAGARPARDGRGRDDHGHESRETNTTRLTLILNDPALRLLFREFLRETLCEENLSFWLDVREFGLTFRALSDKTLDNIRETLAAAYGIYNAFLAPGSPCELNIDHTLRQDLASRMTRAVAKDEQSMYASLKEVAILFDRAQEQVFKLMAGDSVPKFTKTTRYLQIAGGHDIMSDDGSSNGQSSPPL